MGAPCDEGASEKEISLEHSMKPITENAIMRKILGSLSNGRVRLFRNTVGAAWMGVSQWIDGKVLIDRPKRVTFGMATGSSDIIGWRSVIITDEMVGHRVAQFVAIEVKAKGGRVTQEQLAFVETVNSHGGIAGVVRSVDEAEELLK
jgi:hypothetical protein